MDGAAQQTSRRSDLAALTAVAAVMAATLAGLVLRAQGLGRQILIDDEFHGFRAGLRRDLDAAYLFAHNTLPEDPLSDFSSPLALWVRALSDTVGVSEWTLRAPMLLASTATIAVIGVLGLRVLGRRGGVIAAWLVAISPLLVMYGRFFRPYALVAVCGAVALAAAERFRARGDLGSASALGVATALGCWFNVSALPALGVLLLLGIAPALRGRQGRQARRAASLAIAVALALGLALVGPSADALARFAEAKSDGVAAPASAWWGAAQAAAGSRSAAFVVLFAVLAALGSYEGFRRAPAATGLALAALAAQLGVFALLRPHGADQPLVVARYAIAALPGLLLLVAGGLVVVIERMPSAALGTLATAAVLLGCFAAGPLPATLWRENAYTSHPGMLVGAFHELDASEVPDFYRTLSQAPRGVLAEAPWVLEWPLALPADYQAIHGARVVALTGFWTFREPGVALAAHVPWRSGSPDLSEVEQVVIHLDLVEEWRQLTGAPTTMPLDRLLEAAERYRTDARALDVWLARLPGWQRSYEDRWLRVYVRRGD